MLASDRRVSWPLGPLPRNDMGEPRTYRYSAFNSRRPESDALVAFEVRVKETDLLIKADRNLADQAVGSVRAARRAVEDYIRDHPLFKSSLKPYEAVHPAPPIIIDMARAASRAGVGPMAAVAGAIAEHVGRELLKYSAEVLVENGGDVFVKTQVPRLMGIYAGLSSLSQKIALKISPGQTPLGVCTSSGTVGPSLSFGRADAAVILSSWTALADAAATAVANTVQGPDDIGRGLERAMRIEGVTGAVIVLGDHMGAFGEVELERV